MATREGMFDGNAVIIQASYTVEDNQFSVVVSYVMTTSNHRIKNADVIIELKSISWRRLLQTLEILKLKVDGEIIYRDIFDGVMGEEPYHSMTIEDVTSNH